MTITAEGRLRPRLVKVAAGLVLVGSASGLMASGVAHAAVAPPINVTVTNVPGPPQAINIDWDTGTTPPAPPATLTPTTYYRVRVDNPATAVIDFETFVPATQTEVRNIAVLPATLYNITVEANDENSFAAVGPFAFTTAAGPTVECSTVATEWAPFCTVDAFIRQQYRDWQDRTPSLDELNFWRTVLQPRDTSAGGTQNNFLDAFRQNDDIKAGPVVRLYIAFFLRNPEIGGYQYWLNAVTAGGRSMGQVADFFAASGEFQARYGALDNAEFVSLVYNNVLGRNPDAAGFAYWTRELNAGRSRGWMMSQFTEAPSQEFQNRTRIAVATTEVYAEMLNRAPTLAEYDAATLLLAGAPYPLTPASVNPLYNLILGTTEYRSLTRQGGPIVIR